MVDSQSLAVFVAASLALLIVPGPAVFYIVTRSVAQGRSAGLTSVLGVQTGGLIHVAAAALGISALLASSATAFTVVKYTGAVYLVVLGLQRLRRAGAADVDEPAPATRARLFRQGVVVNVLNPKTATFFLAFLPQFVDPRGGPAALQVLVLGGLFVALATLCDSLYALAAGRLADRLRASVRARRRLDFSGGAVLVALGGVAAATGERPQRA